ncbi:hypothetical protein LX99_02057 [Mucilaginibacter oryzae]|uniref:Uncharacterized protein n=1 Tax=Mucilaginibacter oryzae TaxID=468058 RepID=A0A316HCS9_9SPHI|nr:hypothetical protein [Mucilaginibacter oryzae]PWK78217.1 hypothetical protein LX99_02057 [Mucilaginibacter oryzae]
MKQPVIYDLDTDDGLRHITIRPVHQKMPGTDVYATGVFSLDEGETDLGDIVFDDNMQEWEYTGMGNLSHNDAKHIARFVKLNLNALVAE